MQTKLIHTLSFLLLFTFVSFESLKAETPGCTDPLADNYDSNATQNDGSCLYPGTVITFTERIELPSQMDETSGLIYWDNSFWTHNDDTDLNLYRFSFENPNEFTAWPLNGLTNIDWEEITQDDNYLYIGDFGNNSGNRTDLKIYRIRKSSVYSGEPEVEIIAFSYEDQEDFNPPGTNQTDFDSEAFIVKGDRIFLFTKEWVSRGTTVYEIPNQPGEHVALNKGRLQIGAMVTGSVYLEQENLIAFIGYNFPQIGPTFMYLLYDFEGDDFFGGNKRMLVLSLSNFLAHQVEAITTVDGLTFYATNEFASGSGLTIPQRMHSFDLSPFLESYLISLDSPTQYYYRGYGTITEPESWATNPNGSGRSPVDFSADNTEYIVSPSDSYLIDSDWDITGENVSITVGNGSLPTSLTLNSAVNARFNVLNNATLIVDNTTIPEFGDFETGSSVELLNISELILPETSYYNLTIENSSVVAPDENRAISIKGSFLLLENSATDLSAYSLTFDGIGNQLLSSDTSLDLFEFFIDKNSGSLELAENTDIRIQQIFSFEAGTLENNGSLTLESGGVFINNTTEEPELTFERLISSTVNEQGANYWTLLTSPVSGAIAGEDGLLSSIWTQGFTGSDNPDAEISSVYRFDSDNLWQIPQQNEWTPGMGYAVQIHRERNPNVPGNPVDFNAPLNITGQQNTFPNEGFTFPNISYSTESPSGNLHLLGNPFAVSLDWRADSPEAWQRTGVHDFIYILNPSTQTYFITGLQLLPESLKGLITTEPVIGPFQSFWVQTTENAPTLVVGKQARTTENPNNELFNDDENQAVIALKFNEHHYSGLLITDDTHSDNAPYSVDYLNPPGEAYTFFYSCLDDQPSILSSLILEEDTPLQIPFTAGLIAPAFFPVAEGILTWPVLENIPDNWEVTLTDHETGTVTDLKTQSSYPFEYFPVSSEEGFNFNHPECPTVGNSARFVITIEKDATNLRPGIPELPTATELHQNYPNPFNPTTTITYQISESGLVSLDVYDLLGQLVATLVKSHQSAGEYTLSFDASGLSSGVYLYQLKTNGNTLTKKMTVVK